jgi:ATP-dependent Clp protease ATP-binding subunit ClpA
MSPDQALALIDQACSSVNATRAIHQQLMEALSVIKKLVDEKQNVQAKE